MAHKLIWRKNDKKETIPKLSVEDFETVEVREDFCEDKKMEARYEEQTRTNWIKPGVRTGPINLVLYSGHEFCDNNIYLYSEMSPSKNKPQSKVVEITCTS